MPAITQFDYERQRSETEIHLGVVSPRVIISSLTGTPQSETGFYGGFGSTEKKLRKSI